MGFADLTDRAQVHRLRKVAFTALQEYPIDVARVRLQEHGFNTTFRVDAATGEKYALRIDVNRRKPIGALDAEMAWLAAIAAETEVVVPVPQPANDGSLHMPIYFEPLDKFLNVAVMSWLPGKDLASPDEVSLRELGRLTAVLHRHARGWQVPDGAVFPHLASVMMDGTDRIRPGDPMIGETEHDVLVAALDHIEPLFDMMVGSDSLIPIHGDLHGWNLKWLRGRMSIFDFDDAGIGAPAQDLAITWYYQRPEPTYKDALFEGYESELPLPPFTDEQFHAAVAARSLLLVNELMAINTREIRDMFPKFLDNSVLRLRHYMETGEYRSDVPGVVPLS